MTMTGSTNPYMRLVEVFSAKLVLEVFGGAGAIWGWSEVVTLRNPDTLWFWRPCALTFGAIFFVRFLMQMQDFITEHVKGVPVSHDHVGRFTRLLQIFSAKLVLEVFGGGGAIWGFSEALTLRNPETQEFWRVNAAAVGFIFFVRFLMQIKDYIDETEYGAVPNKESSGKVSSTRLVQIFSARLVLEVFGGAGAIWGFSEVLTLRNPDTLWFWRPCALVIGAIFFGRWLLQIRDYLENVELGKSYTRLLQIFAAKLVLEVFGGSGAIWGFSEALTLRNPETVWFWRPCAMVFGVIFFVRFMMQIRDFVDDMEMEARESVAKYGKGMGMTHADENSPLNMVM